MAKVAGRGLESLDDAEFEIWSDFVKQRPDLPWTWRTPRDGLASLATHWEVLRREGQQMSAVLIGMAKPLARRLRATGALDSLGDV